MQQIFVVGIANVLFTDYIIESKNNRLEETLRIIWSNKMAQHSVQANLISVLFWSIHHFPGEINPKDDLTVKKFSLLSNENLTHYPLSFPSDSLQ